MSYILDALRRAEAQRTRGHLPDLHGAAGGAAVLAGPPANARQRLLPLVGLLLLVGLLAVGMIWLLQPAAVAPQDRPVIEANRSLPEAADQPDAASPALPLAPAPTTGDAALLALPRKVVLADRTATGRTPSPETERAAGSPTAVAKQEPAAPMPAVREARKTPPASTVAALPSRQELPADIQRSLPPIVVSGTVYSSDPAQRMLVVNGDLWREGDTVRPDLVLEQIRRRDAVLRFRGLRFTVSP